MKENIEALERLIRVASIELGTSRPDIIAEALRAIEELKMRQIRLMSIVSMSETDCDGDGRIYPFQIKEALGKL